MADNPVEHSCTKHIAIQYHFLRDHQQKGDIEIAYINTKEQLADIFTKCNTPGSTNHPVCYCTTLPTSIHKISAASPLQDCIKEGATEYKHIL
jgi:hypothetical protein